MIKLTKAQKMEIGFEVNLTSVPQGFCLQLWRFHQIGALCRPTLMYALNMWTGERGSFSNVGMNDLGAGRRPFKSSKCGVGYFTGLTNAEWMSRINHFSAWNDKTVTAFSHCNSLDNERLQTCFLYYDAGLSEDWWTNSISASYRAFYAEEENMRIMMGWVERVTLWGLVALDDNAALTTEERLSWDKQGWPCGVHLHTPKPQTKQLQNTGQSVVL